MNQKKKEKNFFQCFIGGKVTVPTYLHRPIREEPFFYDAKSGLKDLLLPTWPRTTDFFYFCSPGKLYFPIYLL